MKPDSKKGKSRVSVPPDGGWGWLIVAVSFLGNFTIDGVSTSFFVIQNDLESLLSTNSTLIAIIISTYNGLLYMMGPVSSALANRFGFKCLMMSGSLIAVAAIFTCYFKIREIALYILLFGVLAGTGANTIYVTAMVATGFWFEEKRACALGISTCSTGMAALVLPLTLTYIHERFDWASIFLFWAAMFLLCAFGSLLLRPVPTVEVDAPPEQPATSNRTVTSRLRLERKSIRQLATISDPPLRVLSQPSVLFTLDEKCCGCVCCYKCFHKAKPPKEDVIGSRPLYRSDIFYPGSVYRIAEKSIPKDPPANKERARNAYTMSVSRLPTRKDLEEEILGKTCCPEAVVRTLTTMLNFSLLKNPIFILLALSATFQYMGLYIPYLYLAERTRKAGMPESMSRWLVPCVGIGVMIGRALIGILLSIFPFMSAFSLATLGLFLSAGTLLSGFITINSYVQLSLCVLYGFTYGIVAPLRSVVAIDFIGLDELTSITGLLFLFQGVGSFLGPPVAQAFTNWRNNENWGIYVASACYLLAALFMLPVKLVKNRMDKRNRTKTEEN